MQSRTSDGARSSTGRRARRSLPKPSLVDQCYAMLRAAIVRCELRPGERLTEKLLIDRTGFGRTPVREALAKLDHDGLIQTLPRSGYRVAPLSAKTINDLYDVWRLVAPLMARRAAENMTPEQRDELVQLQAMRTEEPRVILENSWRLFGLLARATANPELIHINNRVAGEMERIFTAYYATPEGLRWHNRRGLRHDPEVFNNPDVAEAMVALAVEEWRSDLLQLFGQELPDPESDAAANDT